MKANDVSSFYYVKFDEPVYNVNCVLNSRAFKTKKLRFEYNSLVTPPSVFDFTMDTQQRELLKVEQILGGYNASNYQSERIFATSHDGIQVPISLVYKKGMNKDSSNKFLLYGYCAYGYSLDLSFSSNRISLLDRGFIFGMAHIRGGEDMGRKWYETGKLLKKKNTFEDFVACAKHVIKEKYTSPLTLGINGGSAGGLLMGAVTNNMATECFKVVITRVPFVDVINTMLDATIPLTTVEWEEWGNPLDLEYYHYMKSYSPYDNIEAKRYPAMLVTAGLNDPRVQYWEPAKYVAKLRVMKKDDNLLLLKTNMGAGHGGSSGRYDYLKEMAFDYAFLLDQIEK